MVPVTPTNKAVRDTIRQTWGKEKLVLGQVVETLFIIGVRGGADAELQQEKLKEENLQHHDLIQSNFQDSYHNLTIKTMVMLEWLAAHCAKASYFIKIDSDMFLHVPNLVKLLLDPGTAKQNYMTGLVWWHSPVIRDPKNRFYLPFDIIKEGEYPPYPLGMAYVMSLDLPAKILQVSSKIKPIYIEDAYMGMCLKGLGISPTNPPEETMFIVNPANLLSMCSLSKVIAVTTSITTPAHSRGLWIESPESFRPHVIMLPYVLLLFLTCGLALASECPEDCSCHAQDWIFCPNRHSTTVPRVPTTTQKLYIFQNGINTLSKEDFKGLGELDMLDLSQNELAEIPDGAFEMLSKLRNLDLSSNQITHISKHSFSGLVQLERLYLHANRIQNIHLEAFEGLEMLLELKLQGNLLTSLPSLHLPRLLLIDLSNNNIVSLGPSDLQTPHLEALKVASVGLTSLNEDLIASLGNLHELDISSNQLAEVPQALKQDSLKGLTKLSLAANPLGELRVEDFQKLTGLQELDISGLNLQGFPQSFFQTFPRLTQLTAAENPFNCLCPLAWFPVWLREKRVTLVRTVETRCHFPLVNAGKMLAALEHKDFACPPTTTVLIGSPIGSTPVPQIPPTSPEATHTNDIPPPPQPSKETVYVKTESYPLPPEPPVSPSTTSERYEEHICPPNICLNGGTCNFDSLGNLKCLCPVEASGLYCENVNEIPEPPKTSTTEVSVAAPEVATELDAISSRQVTSTSILLDLHRFIETRPHIQGIRLTYRNLSGPDRRPIILSVPASYPEYTLRGLIPNCTYSVCASPMGEKINSRANSSVETGSCTEARTKGPSQTSIEPQIKTQSQLTNTLIPALAALALVLALALVTGLIICLRKRRQARAGMELELGPAKPDPMELEGIKTCLENEGNGTLPHKQPDIDRCHTPLPPPSMQQNGGLDYEVPLMPGHHPSNNNIASLKPSYL
ncbi:hypothetical protein Q5P01_025561 [Channa striata]|uniref:Vasorin n=1 Tax=Channa striata TaxID=64152 RepID=A0AA88INN7_CHASR|nr:hypothetical protein Q5P01_025561 [Channa striata]